MYYRCPARTLAPGSPVLATHPPAVYLREDPIQDAVNKWLAGLFDSKNVDRTVAALAASQAGGIPTSGAWAKKRLADAEARLRKFQAAIAAGVEPAALVEAINEAQAERAAAKAELENTRAPNTVSDAEIWAMIDSLSDVGAALSGVKPESLANLYEAVDLQVCYDLAANTADVSIQPMRRVNSKRVRGRSCTLSTRLVLRDPVS
jgi:hypothetical protein